MLEALSVRYIWKCQGLRIYRVICFMCVSMLGDVAANPFSNGMHSFYIALAILTLSCPYMHFSVSTSGFLRIGTQSSDSAKSILFEILRDIERGCGKSLHG